MAMFNARPLEQKLKNMVPLERSLKNLSFEWSHNILVSFVPEHWCIEDRWYQLESDETLQEIIDRILCDHSKERSFKGLSSDIIFLNFCFIG